MYDFEHRGKIEFITISCVHVTDTIDTYGTNIINVCLNVFVLWNYVNSICSTDSIQLCRFKYKSIGFL